ncbi:MAG: glycogen synthase [Myxococcota bacterium]
MNIISISAEVAPWSKTGGLGDVCGALPTALANRGHRVMTISPRYKAYEDAWDTGVRSSFDGHEVEFFHSRQNGVDRVFVGHPALGRGGIYGGENGPYPDNWFRFSLLCRAAILATMELPLNGTVYSNGRDDASRETVFLFHDWHAGLVPAYLETARQWGLFGQSASALVIHNLAHQGTHNSDIYPKLGLPFEFFPALDMHGHINMLKGGMMLADAILTVSPTYAQEICTPQFGMGLDGLLRQQRSKVLGVLNGIDMKSWNPETDSSLTSNFSWRDLSGKSACKAALQKKLGLPPRPKAPLFGFVSRLDFQKGVDVLEQSLPFLVEKGAQVIMLGTGDPKLEAFLKRANHHPCVAGITEFSPSLARQITAGSDFLLMPSRFEPCGLTQQHALRYGTVPIVHATGGLKDTVQSYNPNNQTGNGWAFSPLNASNMNQACHWAILTYDKSPAAFKGIQKRGMRLNRSWDIAAATYERVFAHLLAKRWRQGL